MDAKLAEMLGKITSTPGMVKMGQIGTKATELKLNAEHVDAAVNSICALVITNLDKPEEIRQFVNHIVDAALEGGPELLQALADALKGSMQ